ncbi:MAG TPA: helix-turn-helix domain-containing protein, partial [Micromonospora sp.]
MTVDQVLHILDQAASFTEEHHTVVLTAAGVLLVLLSLAGWWARRRLSRTADAFGRFCDAAAVAVAVALSAEGMWEATTEKLGLADYQALLLFAFAELAMLRAARKARKKVDKGDPPGMYGQIVWTVALLAGGVATSNAPNLTEHLIRLGAPLLVAWQWWADLVDALREKTGGNIQRQRSSWIWTPRRIGIHLGLIQAGEQDLIKVDRDRRIHRLTVTAHRLHHGSKRLAGWRKAKLRRLALHADDTMVTEARLRVARVNQIEKLTHPDAAPVDPVDDATRATLDEVRLIMRQATGKLRAEHQVAFVDNTVWSNPMVRMPRRMAERIGVDRMTQPGDAPATQPTDAPNPSYVTRPPVMRDAHRDAPVSHAVTHPVDAPDAAPVTHPDAPADAATSTPDDAAAHAVTQQPTQPKPPRRSRDVEARRPVSGPPDNRTDAERDAALAAAVDAVLTQGVPVRQAARDAGLPEATLRRRVDKARETQPINGHSF